MKYCCYSLNGRNYDSQCTQASAAGDDENAFTRIAIGTSPKCLIFILLVKIHGCDCFQS